MEKQIYIMRICRNIDNWKKPSSRNVKPKKKEILFEVRKGYGHDVWINDLEKIYDGYHYAFLQPVNHSLGRAQDKNHIIYTLQAGDIITVYLYEFIGIRKKIFRFIIKNLEIINQQQAMEALLYYAENGWLREYRNQVKETGGKYYQFKDALEFFNVRFRPEDLIEIKEQDEVPIEVKSTLEKLKEYQYYTFKAF